MLAYRIEALLLIMVIFLSACQDHTADDVLNHHGGMDMHWGYEGETSPEHWVEIERNSECGGQNQSPVNIIDFNTVSSSETDQLELFYSSRTHLKRATNNGHTIQFDFVPEEDSIMYRGQVYQLVQVHFHEHAEHLISGIIYPLEIHLVHISRQGNIAVIGILGKEGEESQIFKLLESFLPLEMGHSKEINVTCDLNQMLPSERSYYSYNGSLTTPPCTEGVNWIVFQEPIILSLEEVQILKESMPLDNYRNEQPLNGRVVAFNPA